MQPLTRRFDAFLLVMYFGGGTPFQVGDAVMTVPRDATAAAHAVKIPEGEHLLRDDLGIPIMVVNAECEATSCYEVRQPDTDRFRYWEVAGASHVTLPAMASSSPRMERDFGFAIPLDDPSMQSINQVSVAPVVDAALHHLQAWLTDDTPPPVQPRIQFAGEPAQIVRDDNDIACDGIRLPRSRCRWRTTAPCSSPPTSSPGWSASTRTSPSRRWTGSTRTASTISPATRRQPRPR